MSRVPLLKDLEVYLRRKCLLATNMRHDVLFGRPFEEPPCPRSPVALGVGRTPGFGAKREGPAPKEGTGRRGCVGAPSPGSLESEDEREGAMLSTSRRSAPGPGVPARFTLVQGLASSTDAQVDSAILR